MIEQRRTALITGASGAIGSETSQTLALAGYDCIICGYKNEKKLKELQQQILEHNVRCESFIGDLSDPEEVDRLWTTIEKQDNPVDILINIAAVSNVVLLQDMPLEQWNSLLAINLTTPFLMCKKAIPHMLKSGRGKILNISSVWGISGASCETAYSASKGGLNAFTKALAKELAPSNIQVNAIAFGAIDTVMNSRQINPFLDKESRAALIDEIPAGRLGTCQEAAQIILSLAKAPEYLTGQVVVMDGGWT